jgi:hypothetical protein
MVRPNYNLIRFVKRCIRAMKKEYGGPITVYKLGVTTTNLQTGAKGDTRSSIFVQRAVVLPSRLSREAVQSISLISANKQVVQGGTYDPGRRTFIIDRTDVPNWDLQHDDWIVYNDARYDIKTIDEFEQGTGWLIVAKKVDNAPVYQDRIGGSHNNIILSHTATGVVT